VFSDTGTWLS